jgi:uncharacterized protein YndB with AHSA1/START domain
MSTDAQEILKGPADLVGKVSLTLSLPASPAKVWSALTDPYHMNQWFGILTPGLREGCSAILDFEDGDFFELERIKLAPPRLLQYCWRFLGIGPLDTIRWEISPSDDGCLVVITDTEPYRSFAQSEELKMGWLDFSRRLEGYLISNLPTRYDWRREFEASIPVQASQSKVWDKLLAGRSLQNWLPILHAGEREQAFLLAGDGQQPEKLSVEEIWSDPPHRLSFNLGSAQWRFPTSCLIELMPRGESTLLSLHHIGWEGISRFTGEQLRQRKRFSTIWISRLKQGRALVENRPGR